MEEINLESVNKLINESDIQSQQLVQRYQRLQNIIQELEKESQKVENKKKVRNAMTN